MRPRQTRDERGEDAAQDGPAGVLTEAAFGFVPCLDPSLCGPVHVAVAVGDPPSFLKVELVHHCQPIKPVRQAACQVRIGVRHERGTTLRPVCLHVHGEANCYSGTPAFTVVLDELHEPHASNQNRTNGCSCALIRFFAECRTSQVHCGTRHP